MLVAAGGTAGHLAPALAVADSLRERGWLVRFAVSTRPADAQLVGARGFDLDAFRIGGIPRGRAGIRQLRALWQAVVAVFACLGILGRRRPDVVLGGGGFVAAPMAVAAWLRRIPVVVTEADAHLGLANRLATRFARTLCAAYPLPDARDRQVVTGRPIDPAFAAVTREQGRAAFDIPPDELVLVVVGGSGGATHLNSCAVEAFGRDAALEVDGIPLHVLHVTGRRDHDEFAATPPANPRYRLLAYCDRMPELLACADLVVSRAGGSVFEIAAVGRAAILVPFPHAAGDHQRLNALHFVEVQAAVLLDDAAMTPARLRGEVRDLLSGDGTARRQRLAENIAALARPDAADRVADAVEAQTARVRANEVRRG